MSNVDKKGDRWLLPEGIEEVLPPYADQVETLRRDIIDLFQSWGYELVIPPLIEYLESLLTGSGHELDLQTFKVTDQLTGRMMGIRADMTPQIARIDAHHLKKQGINRLCYLGPVLHTTPRGLSASRNPLQIGAELFGHEGLESDVEVLTLMIACLNQAGLHDVYVDIGHIGIFRGLIEQAGLDQNQEARLQDILQRKAVPELDECLAQWQLDSSMESIFSELIHLNGDKTILEQAEKTLLQASEKVQSALSDLKEIISQVEQRMPDIALHIDLAELRGYHYHTGVMFAAYLPQQGQAIARGGRYDKIGEVFGRARPATGFSTDLKSLVRSTALKNDPTEAITAPWQHEPELADAIQKLRAQGHRVIYSLPDENISAELSSSQKKLEKDNDQWVVK